MSEIRYKGPIVLVVMDGVGINEDENGNGVLQAHTEFLDYATKNYPNLALQASGEAVGILPGVMGNSEVGHNAIGAGQIIKQGIAKLEDVFRTGEVWQTKAWQGAIANVKANDSVLHFSGILSDGGVHSDIKYLKKMVEQAQREGVKRVRIHLILDGRDVLPQSALKYVDDLENLLVNLPGKPDYKIASGGGRMLIVTDRYEAEWGMVERGWNLMVYGQAEHVFRSAREAILSFRGEEPDLNDQFIPPFAVVDEMNKPVGKIKDGDSVIFYNFRADRAIEISQAFTYEDFPYFDRGTEGNRRLNVFYAGMMEYNSDTHVPEYQLVTPVEIKNTLSQLIGENKISQLAVAERVKFGHITYYFNGNSYEKAEGEEQIEVLSDTLPFNERPWMKAAEITDQIMEKIEDFRFIRVNYAGGDMVGHFGELEPTITAMEAIDIQLNRLAKKVDELGGMMIITADHGNAEELIDKETGEKKTSHTTNLVPFILYDNTENKNKYRLKQITDAGLSNIAPTVADLFGLKKPEPWRESLIERVSDDVFEKDKI